MPRVNYLPEALNDLHGIWRYVNDKSRNVVSADRLIVLGGDYCGTASCTAANCSSLALDAIATGR